LTLSLREADARVWLESEFNRVWPYLEPAIEKTKGRFSKETVWDDLERGNYQLWPLPNSGIVTEIITYPTGLKAVMMVFIGGKYKEIRNTLPAIYEWARGLGCTHAEGVTNPAWRRHGYEEMGVHIVKEI
jgi:hypothetical protein